MTCPVCSGKTGSRGTWSDCESVYRRRKCLSCDYIFYTSETESDDARKEINAIRRENYHDFQASKKDVR